MSAGNLGFFININSTIRKITSIEKFDKLSLILKNDTSKYGLPVPEVLGELLNQDLGFNTVFHSLTPGKQRSLLHLVGKYKIWLRCANIRQSVLEVNFFVEKRVENEEIVA